MEFPLSNKMLTTSSSIKKYVNQNTIRLIKKDPRRLMT